jgi:hypothetical protein
LHPYVVLQIQVLPILAHFPGILQIAASSMTETIMPPEMLKHLTPDFVAPVVGVLCAPKVSV